MNKEIEEMIKNRIEDIYQSGEYIYQAKELEEILSYIEQLQEDNEYLKRLCETQNNREYRSKFLKEFQEEHGKNVYPDYDEIYKRYDEIKEKLEQLETDYEEAIDSVTWWHNRYNAIERDRKNILNLVDKLQNNRDKALKHIDCVKEDVDIIDRLNRKIIDEQVIRKQDIEKLEKILKGGSDE